MYLTFGRAEPGIRVLNYANFEVSCVRMSHQFKVTKLLFSAQYSRSHYVWFSCVNLTDFVLLPHSVCTFSFQCQKEGEKLRRLTYIPQRTPSRVLCIDIITIHIVV
jgi:hypothetical protein